MNRRSWMWLVSCLTVSLPCVAQPPPLAPQEPVTDTYFGRTVVDPYRWLENLDDARTKTWLAGQASYTRSVLDSMPGRAAFSTRLRYYVDSEPYTLAAVTRAGGNLFYIKRARGMDQGVLVVRPAAGGSERVLLDPNALSTPGHHVSLVTFLASADGKRVVAVTQAGGAEVGTARFFDVAGGRSIGDTVTNIFGQDMAFSADGTVFYYTAMEALSAKAPQIDRFRHLTALRHTVGTPTTNDQVLAGHGAATGIDVPDFGAALGHPSDQAHWALVFIYPGTESSVELWMKAAGETDIKGAWRKLASVSDRVTDAYVRGDDVYVVTFKGAPNGKVLRMDARKPDLATAQVIVPEGSDVLTAGDVLGGYVLLPARDALYVRVLRAGYGQLLRVSYGDRPRTSTVPMPPGMQVVDATANAAEQGVILRLSSWTDPGDFYRYDESLKMPAPMGLAGRNTIDRRDLVAEEVMVKGKDGTDIPLSIIYRKGLRRDGTAPTFLTGYGAYGMVDSPIYQRGVNAWIERGGIFAVAHVRGGGEFGERWHLAGKIATKHNTWEDFIASGHYLVDHGYTSPGKLGAWSQSAGGILIGRSITTDPALFAAVVDGVPMSDTMRYETDANGPSNTVEFGSVATREGAEALYAMSAYHHVEKGVKYPAVLVTAGANDPRVPPWQGAKMAAMLQGASAGGPVLLRVNRDAGHFADTVDQRVADFSDYFTFMLWHFGDPEFQPKEL